MIEDYILVLIIISLELSLIFFLFGMLERQTSIRLHHKTFYGYNAKLNSILCFLASLFCFGLAILFPVLGIIL